MEERDKIPYVTSGETCFKITGEEMCEVPELPSKQEEADTRMFLHAIHIDTYAYEAIVILYLGNEIHLII